MCHETGEISARRWLWGAALPVLLALPGCQVRPSQEIPSVVMDPAISFADAAGREVRARFGHLADHSLSFVRFTYLDGQEYTLPQVVSASGARYTDEFKYELWNKGRSVTIRELQADGAWHVVFDGTER